MSVTNDIYTEEDAEPSCAAAPCCRRPDRGRARPACCPHTAIRDDIAANLDAVERAGAWASPNSIWSSSKSGGDNLTATFSYGLVDHQIFVIDVAGGDKVPRKGGPGITSSDLLVINKTDLAPLVGRRPRIMARDAEAARAGRPILFTSLVADPHAARIAAWVRQVRAEAAAK